MGNPGKELAMAMKSMKVDREPKVDMAVDISKEEDYPYGLRLSLNEKSLKTLGLDIKDFTVEAAVTLQAKAEVCSVNSSRHGCGVELQITDLALEE